MTKRSLLVVVSIALVLVVTLARRSNSDPLTECFGYCEAYWGDTDGDTLTPMADEGEYYTCVDTCEEILLYDED